ncbi:MAG: 16S rRNA (cytidine(1402)-2'-O)-methyltransferase, partial [Alphaproteobacteria bacterium]|nr:16S rRNA (cytidine(1402)-2'-O)-methyltransferase [Alphaproteobacteria bacterium]
MKRQRNERAGSKGCAPSRSSESLETAKPNDLETRSKPAPGLYLVATPIGNVEDITLRALRVLAAADMVACEDTRMTGKLMMLLGIRAPLTPYHEHNAERARPALLARLARGEVVALVSDAGTPMVSDPGWRLAREA